MKPLSLTKALVVFGAPLSYFVIGVMHPLELHVGDQPDRYIAIHVFQLLSIWGMALMLWFMTEGVNNRPARIARVAILRTPSPIPPSMPSRASA